MESVTGKIQSVIGMLGVGCYTDKTGVQLRCSGVSGNDGRSLFFCLFYPGVEKVCSIS